MPDRFNIPIRPIWLRRAQRTQRCPAAARVRNATTLVVLSADIRWTVMKFRAWHLAFALLLPLWAQAQESATAAVLALSGGRIIDGWGGTPIENGVVVIRGNKIEAVGPAAAVAIPAGARTIDVNEIGRA